MGDFWLTLYPDRWSTADGEGSNWAWAEIVAFCSAPEPIKPDEKDNLPFWHGARIAPGGCRRNTDVVEVSVMFVDVDKRLPKALENLRAWGILALAFASPSCKKDRGRILIPLSRPVTPAEFRVLWAIVNARLGGMVDPQTKSPSHGYYTPAAADPAKFWIEEINEDGDVLDVDAESLQLAIPEDEDPIIRAPTHDELADYNLGWRRQQVEDYANKIQTVSEGNRHGTLFRIAQTCLDYALPPDETEAIVLEFNDDRCQPPKDHDVVRANVLQNLERYRRHAVGCAITLATRVRLDHSETLDRVMRILGERAPRLFTRKGTLTEVKIDKEGVRMEPTPVKRISTVVSQYVRFFSFKEATRNRAAGWYPCGIPTWVPEELAVRGSYPELGCLEGIANVPTLRSDGSVLCEQGYDTATGLYYTGEDVDVPRAPTREEGLEALEAVEHLFYQFPIDALGLAAHMALMLTTVAMPYLRGPVPIAVYDANQKQTGKSILAQSICILSTGERPPRTEWPGNEKDMKDTLHTRAATDGRVLYVDNVPNGMRIESAVLDGAMTSMSVTRRKHYLHTAMDLPFRPIVTITGNGVGIGGDLLPRCLYIRLVSEHESPEERDDIEITDLLGFIQEHRNDIAVALLTVWRAWLAAGAPRADLPKWHTVDGWAPVRHLLAWYGRPDPADSRKQATDRDDDTDGYAMLLEFITDHWPEGAAANQIASALKPQKWGKMRGANAENHDQDRADYLRGELRGWLKIHGVSDLDDPAGIGLVLHRYRDRVLNGRILTHKRTKSRRLWIVQPATEGDGHA